MEMKILLDAMLSSWAKIHLINFYLKFRKIIIPAPHKDHVAARYVFPYEI